MTDLPPAQPMGTNPGDDGGLEVGGGNDDVYGLDTGVTLDANPTYDSGDPTTADTPDPYGEADDGSYTGTPSGPDAVIDYLPPWALTRAPGSEPAIVAGEITPINPWLPVIALLNADQLALLNRESGARQAAAVSTFDPRCV